MVWSALACVWLIRATEHCGRLCPLRRIAAENATHACAIPMLRSMAVPPVLIRAARTALLLALLLSAPALRAQDPSRVEAFGRWQPALRSCRSSEPGLMPQPCEAVLVEQRSAGVFRLRWRGPQLRPLLWRQLIFVGILPERAEPLLCRQAVCRLLRPITLTISTVSSSPFRSSGYGGSAGVHALPGVWLASGQCRLDLDGIRCEAQAMTGEVWTAEAQLR